MCRSIEIIHFSCMCSIDSRDCQPIAYHPCRTAKGILKDLNTKGPFNFCTVPGTDPLDRSYPTTLRVKSLKPYYGREPYFPLSCQEQMMHNECLRIVYGSIAEWASEGKMHLSYGYLEVLEALAMHQALSNDEKGPSEYASTIQKPEKRTIIALAKKVLKKSATICPKQFTGRDLEMQAIVREREQSAIAAANVNLRAQGLEMVHGAAEREAERKRQREQREREQLELDFQRGLAKEMAVCWRPLEDIGRVRDISVERRAEEEGRQVRG